MLNLTISENEILGLPNDADLGAYLREKFWAERNDPHDKCVLCGKISPYRRSTHIDFRIGYVEGAGQGCFQSHCCQNDSPNNIDL